MTTKDSLPESESQPIQEITQADKQNRQKQADIPPASTVVQSLNCKTGEPKANETEEETDRKQDKAISSLAEQTDWIEKQTWLMDKQTSWIRRQTIWTSVLAVFTLGVLFYHGWIMSRQSQAMVEQTRIMQEQLQVMDKSLRIGERAYVGVHSIQADLKIGQIKVLLENIGHVPAQNVLVFATQVRTILGGVGVGDRAISSRVTIDTGRTKLFPGNFKMPIIIPLKDLSPEEVKAIQSGMEWLTITLQIQYGDGFGNTETSRFVFRYTPSPNEGWVIEPLLGNFSD
jgi:hypothetical protein